MTASGPVRYLSTRGGIEPAPFSAVLVEGLAADGGLAVPDRIPRFTTDELARLRGRPYADVALAVIRRFVDDIDPGVLAEIVVATYGSDVFAAPDVITVDPLGDGLHLVGLSHGPTLAFKDMALQLVGRLLDHVLERSGGRLTVLGATSGDTGPSAEYAMIGRSRIDVVMLSPEGRTSPFQAAQMYALDEPNIVNLVVRGVFDDCQDLVKAVNADADFKTRHHIGAVNSINWSRVLAQVVYYVAAYLRVADQVGDEVSFTVPTGNFGNVYAGFVARSMGVPIRRLVVACNENDVLDEFFRTGRYRVRGRDEVVATSSPSMDISKASNFERYIHHLLGDDPVRTTALFATLADTGGFDLGDDPAFARVETDGMVSGTASHADRIATIADIHRRFGRLIDPHTATGVKVGSDQQQPGIPMICLETAQPVKFAGAIEEAVGFLPAPPPQLADLLDRPQRFTVIDADPDQVKTAIAAHGEPASAHS